MGVLNVSIPPQAPAVNLCWAAVTIGVCTSLNDPQRTLWEVATKYLRGCDGDPATTACDLTYDLDAAIIGYGHGAASRGGQLNWAALQQQIDTLKRPVPVILQLQVTNHACLIKGCVVVGGVQQVVLLDPSCSPPTDHYINWDAFCDGSALNADWIESYRVS